MQDADKLSRGEGCTGTLLSAQLFCKPRTPLKIVIYVSKHNRTTPEPQDYIQKSLKHYAARSKPETKENMIYDPFI